MIRRVAFVLLLLAAPVAFAAEGDDAGAAPAPAAKPSGEVSAFKARVKLGNGRSLAGVVRVAGTWERRDEKSGWTACGKDEPGACVRLWNVSGRDGFLTLSAKDVASVENEGALGDADLKKLAEGAEAAGKRAAAEAEKLRKEREVRRAAEAAAAQQAAADAAAKKEAEAEEARAKADRDLLAKFPPKEWNAERRDEIKRRELIMKLMPTDLEREFVANFDAWARAAAAAKADEDAKAAAEAKAKAEADAKAKAEADAKKGAEPKKDGTPEKAPEKK